MNGLIKVSAKSDTWEFEDFTEKDGLANHVVYAVMHDSTTHSLWLSTNNGISRLDLEEMKFDNYDSRDGLQGSEFNQGAFSQTRDGELIFGGIGGYTRFYPSKIQEDLYPPKVVLTHFSDLDFLGLFYRDYFSVIILCCCCSIAQSTWCWMKPLWLA